MIVDVGLWPIATIHMRANATREQFEVFRRTYEEAVYTRHERYVSITHLALLGPPGAAERQRLAAWMKEHDAYMRRYAIANITVVRSALVRGAMTALFWIQRPPVRQETCKTLPEAVGMAIEELRADGQTTAVGDVQAWLASNAAA